MDLTDKKVVIIGGGSGIGARLAADLTAAGAKVIVAGRTTSPAVDLTDEDSIRRLAEEVGEADHLVSLASAPANGPVAELDRDAVHTAFDAKVIGPILLAKHFTGRIRPGGSILLFSGFIGWRPSPARVVMATTNVAVAALAEALAVELAPVRVNAVSPGIIDSGVWDGPGKQALFEGVAAKNPARRVGQPSDVSAAALLALTNPFLTGATLHIDGGARLA
ncbi:SDR family oxidoreductase [Kutzneria buriramensis]|uniref:NAD(P)-dependent dehydrogenase (Short-subunit alcohol dehydrogenase family) n=1 Tax=Kutzneria buriramensis TaxID=1045776 RepID=A0A3E0GUH7_9PSEU|nr:SDR family oxidoreductase [Kutzneria buriramensis]REH27081.1 NAD(P)-dependent dehydrogenase (short-subunit alcohol dehydrogenase family) [Kutzneria buriramensis]